MMPLEEEGGGIEKCLEFYMEYAMARMQLYFK
jgi:hypothetical protein